MAKAVINLQKESGGITKISSADGVGVTELVVPESGNLVSVDTAVIDNAIARYDGTTGKLQNSGVVIDDNGVLKAARLLAGNNEDITPGINGNGQVQISGNGYSAFIALDSIGMHIGNNSGSRVLTFDIDETERMRIDTSGNLLLKSGTGALGYGNGAGGIVTQLTSKSTAVTLNKPCGIINTHTEELAGGATTTFQLKNSLLSLADGVIVTNSSYGVYSIRVGIVTTGEAYIYITNTGTISYSHTFPIQFQVIKGAIA